MDDLQLRLGDFFRNEQTIIAKKPNSISDPQDCNELIKFHTILAKVYP